MLDAAVTNHEIYMWRCLHLAQLGVGTVAPNPLVGAVVVHEGRVIGEGWHRQYGNNHAEREAIANIANEDRYLLSDSTLYVNLEPCAHHGKTPPCADYILECGIKRVVVGCGDPFPQVAGKGIEKLRANGVTVVTDVLQRESTWLNRRFMTFHLQQRPYIILKWAQTQNGYFAPNDGNQKWISNPSTKTLAHRWRTEEPAIMVGTNTARIDNPQLNARLWQGKQPIRIVIDRHLTLSQNLYLFDQSQRTIVFTEKKIPLSIINKQKAFNINADNANIINGKNIDKPLLQYFTLNSAQDLLSQIWRHLFEENIQSVIIEGGAQLLCSVIATDIWDEARIFIAPTDWENGIVAPILPPESRLVQEQPVGNNAYRLMMKE